MKPNAVSKPFSNSYRGTRQSYRTRHQFSTIIHLDLTPCIDIPSITTFTRAHFIKSFPK